MRRKVSMLTVLVALLLWQIHAAEPKQARESLSAPWFYSRAAAPVAPQDSCCINEGETDPHDECVDNSCMSVSGCGVSDCSSCTGCDPGQEAQCISDGGTWDSGSCTCTLGCDPYGSEEEACYYNGGTWDPYSCYCDYPTCNPWIDERVYSYDCSYCDDWSGDYYDCTCYDHCYTVYCEDGSVVDSWCEYGTEVCAVYPGGCGS